MKIKNADMDMLRGPLLKNLLLFTIPIALCSILQQLFNAADTAVVGYFGDKNALAAVGTNTEIVALIVTVSSGLSVGANILIAGLIGKERKEEIPSAVKTALMLSVIIGILARAPAFLPQSRFCGLSKRRRAYFVTRRSIFAYTWPAIRSF